MHIVHSIVTNVLGGQIEVAQTPLTPRRLLEAIERAKQKTAARITLATFTAAYRLDPMVPLLAAISPVPLEANSAADKSSANSETVPTRIATCAGGPPKLVSPIWR